MSQTNSRASWRLLFAFKRILLFSTVAVGLRLNAQGNITPTMTAEPRDSVPIRESGELGDLLRLANSVSPAILAARARVGAARARVGPAAAWPDPMLMAGIQNLPLGKMNSPGMTISLLPGDDMTMKMIGVSQTVPYPGKSGIRRQIAERELEAATMAVRASSLEVARDVKKSFYELAYLDRAIEIVNQNQPVLADVIRVAEAHYASGSGGQQDILKARVEAARLGEAASTLLEQRRSTLAELNALLDRESTTPVARAQIPERVTRAALAADPAGIRFATQVLGSRAAASPLPPLATLQDLALNQNPQLRGRQAMIGAQSERVALAQKAVKPDIDLSLQYGQRTQRPNMISAVVSIPLPIHKRARQDQEISEARAELGALQAERTGEINKVRAEVARLVSDLERSRSQLALYAKAILPQGRAAVAASLAGYQAGKADLLSVLGSQTILFEYETANYRALTDFAKALADLDAVV
ncbi:MAG: TolC family protein, partial [Gemmatimonadota bacterium]|nr:TolC family protein [Gemmatimonadota bacterium]